MSKSKEPFPLGGRCVQRLRRRIKSELGVDVGKFECYRRGHAQRSGGVMSWVAWIIGGGSRTPESEDTVGMCLRAKRLTLRTPRQDWWSVTYVDAEPPAPPEKEEK